MTLLFIHNNIHLENNPLGNYVCELQPWSGAQIAFRC